MENKYIIINFNLLRCEKIYLLIFTLSEVSKSTLTDHYFTIFMTYQNNVNDFLGTIERWNSSRNIFPFSKQLN